MSLYDKRWLANAINLIAFAAIFIVTALHVQPELIIVGVLAIVLLASNLYLILVRCPNCRALFRSTRRGTTEAMRITPNCPNCSADLRCS